MHKKIKLPFLNVTKIQKIKISHPEGTLYSVPKKYICFKPDLKNQNISHNTILLSMTKKKRKNNSSLSYSKILLLIEKLKSKTPKQNEEKNFTSYLPIPFFTKDFFDFLIEREISTAEFHAYHANTKKDSDKNELDLYTFLPDATGRVEKIDQKQIIKKTYQGKILYLEKINSEISQKKTYQTRDLSPEEISINSSQEKIQRRSKQDYLDLKIRKDEFFEKILKYINLSKNLKQKEIHKETFYHLNEYFLPSEKWKINFKKIYRESEIIGSNVTDVEKLYQTYDILKHNDIDFIKNFIIENSLKEKNESLKSIISGYFSNLPNDIATKTDSQLQKHQRKNYISIKKQPEISFEETLKSKILLEKTHADLKSNLENINPEFWSFYKCILSHHGEIYNTIQITPRGLVLKRETPFNSPTCLKYHSKKQSISLHEKIKDKKAYLKFKNENKL